MCKEKEENGERGEKQDIMGTHHRGPKEDIPRISTFKVY